MDNRSFGVFSFEVAPRAASPKSPGRCGNVDDSTANTEASHLASQRRLIMSAGQVDLEVDVVRPNTHAP
jgi:hypothetical protein